MSDIELSSYIPDHNDMTNAIALMSSLRNPMDPNHVLAVQSLEMHFNFQPNAASSTEHTSR